jgi:hypothetical protein
MRFVRDENRVIAGEICLDDAAVRRHRDRFAVADGAFDPRNQRVGAGRHAVDLVAAIRVRHAEEAVREHQDEGVHVRVDLAEHAHHARPIEPHGLRSSRGIASQIEPLRLREREDVVVGASSFGKSTVVPTVTASRCGTNVSLRWSICAWTSSASNAPFGAVSK